ncbi:antitoxin Xre/MbcA/ParS toxin-binding domain-containing protein [Microbulbifer taiwanensis]|uniref:Antitoxin Xre/MbcA/ParS toxin-binding domain-containing protein n=1 Tax=Microbulbifer taiwanensis TaxID=986746 RepID=A0ABW1YI03_9GAMM
MRVFDDVDKARGWVRTVVPALGGAPSTLLLSEHGR